MSKLPSLYESVVGSHMWKMDHALSDLDIFYVYAEDPKRILDGTANTRSQMFQETKDGKKVDIAYHEVGHLVDQLLKGNINYVVGITTPIVRKDHPAFAELRNLMKVHAARNVYHSVRGMATGNIEKYMVKEADTSNKKCAQIIRTIRFAEILLKEGVYRYETPPNNLRPEDVIKALAALDETFRASSLPMDPDPKPFRAWLLKLRLDQMKGSGSHSNGAAVADAKCNTCGELFWAKDSEKLTVNEVLDSEEKCPNCGSEEWLFL